MSETGSDDAAPPPTGPAAPPPVPSEQRFFMPPPPRSIAETSQISDDPQEGFSLTLTAPTNQPTAAPVAGIVLQSVDPPRRRPRSDTTLLIALLTAVAVLAVLLGAAVLFGEAPG